MFFRHFGTVPHRKGVPDKSLVNTASKMRGHSKQFKFRQKLRTTHQWKRFLKINQADGQRGTLNPHIFNHQCKKDKYHVEGAGARTKSELAVRDQTPGLSPDGESIKKKPLVDFKHTLHQGNIPRYEPPDHPCPCTKGTFQYNARGPGGNCPPGT
jgi:hypothetical protein